LIFYTVRVGIKPRIGIQKQNGAVGILVVVAAESVDRFHLVAIAAVSRVTGMGSVLDQFMGLQQIRQYDMSCQEDIGRNLSSAGSTSTNRKENARFWLRKRIWGTFGRAGYTSGRV